MFINALVWAFASAYEYSESQSPYIAPWEIKRIEEDDDCPRVCGNWSALYLSGHGCVDGEMVATEDLRFCPDREAVEAWTVENEENFETLYMLTDGMPASEREVFERMTFERKMKLSVHPWAKFLTQEILDMVETRRIRGKEDKFKCVGPKVNGRVKHYRGVKPEKVFVRHGDYIKLLEVYYPDGQLTLGGEDSVYDEKKQKLSDCVEVVFMKHDGSNLIGLQFLGRDKETKFFGADEASSYVIVAPSGTCLGDMRMRGDDVVQRLCVKFNGEDAR